MRRAGDRLRCRENDRRRVHDQLARRFCQGRLRPSHLPQLQAPDPAVHPPAFGPLKLSTLTSGHVQSLYASKPRGVKPLKPSSVQYIHAVLHRALEQAVRFHMIPFDPAARVDPPKVRQDEITPLNTEQSRTLLAAAEDSGAAKLSGRLKWSDVDLVKGTFGWPGSYRGCATVTDLCSQSRRMPAGAP
jgi:hypothetical protein